MHTEIRRLIDELMTPDAGGLSPLHRLKSHMVGNSQSAKVQVSRPVLVALVDLAALLAASPAPGVVDAAREVDTIVQQTGHAHDWFPALAKLHQALAASPALPPQDAGFKACPRAVMASVEDGLAYLQEPCTCGRCPASPSPQDEG